MGLSLLICILLSSACAFEDVSLLQVKHDPMDMLCNCGGKCPKTLAEAKALLIQSCMANSQKDTCVRDANALFTGALDSTFEVAMCPVLRQIFGRLDFLGNLSDATSLEDLRNLRPRRVVRDGEKQKATQRYSSGDDVQADDTEGLNVGTIVITHGDNNNISVSTDHSVDNSIGNSGKNVETSVGSENTVPINVGSGNVVIVPVGSGNVVPVASGNTVVIPVGGGNQISIPAGSGNVIVIPVGSGTTTNQTSNASL